LASGLLSNFILLPSRPGFIIPYNCDQFYWAHRVQQLGVGVSGPLRDELSVEGLSGALRAGLRPEVTAQAQALAGRLELHGARIAAQRLTDEFA
jgi:UDP:flavonoid glycosyltransferase YjiC (YdhE family)